jgi:bacterioferritin-associated ferredoxin
VRVQDADAALALNRTVFDGCEIEVSLAAHVGGLGTHPAIMQQVRLPLALALSQCGGCVDASCAVLVPEAISITRLRTSALRVY